MIVKCIVALLLLTGKLDAHEHHDHAEGVATEEEGFHWTKEKTEYADIQVAVAGPGSIQNFIQVSGKILIHPDYLAYVIPKVEGSVYEVWKNLGDSVDQGEIIALVEGRNIAEAKTAYLSALQKYHLQQTLLNQEMSLRGISAEQDYLNAEHAFDEARIQLTLATQNLYALGLSEEEVNAISQSDPAYLRFHAVKAPLKGKILERNLTLGELIDHSTKAFTIGNLEKVWVEINIPQTDVQYLTEGLVVQIAGMHDKSTLAQICQFNPAISEETRMATAIAEIDNHAEKWSPGEFVTAKIQTHVTQVPLVVPLTALQTIHGEHCVFVENDQEFLPTVVELGKRDDQKVEILSGLKPGENFAATNTFWLKADCEKEEAEHHH